MSYESTSAQILRSTTDRMPKVWTPANGWDIVGESPYGTEVLDSSDSASEADTLCDEYRMAYGPEWSIYKMKG